MAPRNSRSYRSMVISSPEISTVDHDVEIGVLSDFAGLFILIILLRDYFYLFIL